MERLADELPIEQVAKRWIVASDPDEAVAQIKPYLDAGLNHLVFHGPGHDQERFLDPVRRRRPAEAARAGLTGRGRRSAAASVESPTSVTARSGEAAQPLELRNFR